MRNKALLPRVSTAAVFQVYMLNFVICCLKHIKKRICKLRRRDSFIETPINVPAGPVLALSPPFLLRASDLTVPTISVRELQVSRPWVHLGCY